MYYYISLTFKKEGRGKKDFWIYRKTESDREKERKTLIIEL